MSCALFAWRHWVVGIANYSHRPTGLSITFAFDHEWGRICFDALGIAEDHIMDGELHSFAHYAFVLMVSGEDGCDVRFTSLDRHN